VVEGEFAVHGLHGHEGRVGVVEAPLRLALLLFEGAREEVVGPGKLEAVGRPLLGEEVEAGLVDLGVEPDLAGREGVGRDVHAEAKDLLKEIGVFVAQFAALVGGPEPEIDGPPLVERARAFGTREGIARVDEARQVLLQAFVLRGVRERVQASPPRLKAVAGRRPQGPRRRLIRPLALDGLRKHRVRHEGHNLGDAAAEEGPQGLGCVGGCAPQQLDVGVHRLQPVLLELAAGEAADVGVGEPDVEPVGGVELLVAAVPRGPGPRRVAQLGVRFPQPIGHGAVRREGEGRVRRQRSLEVGMGVGRAALAHQLNAAPCLCRRGKRLEPERAHAHLGLHRARGRAPSEQQQPQQEHEEMEDSPMGGRVDGQRTGGGRNSSHRLHEGKGRRQNIEPP
jgi:hypothetical protein